MNRPDLDAEYFLHSGVYGRMCKTGDRARIVKDTKGEFVVEVLRGVGVQEQVVGSEDSSLDGNSVTSMVDSFTETVVANEEKKEIDVTEANVLSLINKMHR